MQRMHQSYKYMKAQQKKLVGVHPTRLLTKTQGILRKPIIGIYKPSSIMKNSQQYMTVTTYETLYHEDHGATLKHKCGKRIVTLSILSFSLIPFFLFFWDFSFLWPLFSFFIWASLASFIYLFIYLFSSGVSSRLMGESQSPSSFPHLGQCSNNDDHHTFIFLTTQQLQLDTQNKI